VRLAESYSNASIVKTFDKVRQTVLTRCKIKGE